MINVHVEVVRNIKSVAYDVELEAKGAIYPLSSASFFAQHENKAFIGHLNY